MKISVFGLGYVGAVSVACLAKDGHQVVGVDPNSTKVQMINDGLSPIIEKDIGDILADGVSAGSITAVTDSATAVASSEVSFVCVGTPSNSNGSLDLSYVRTVCSEIGQEIAKKRGQRHLVVMRSTMLPGSMRQVVIPVLEEASGMKAGVDFGVCNNPEFLREGSAVYDYYNPPKIVIGELSAGDGDKVAEIYSGLDAPMIRTSVDVAEMVKYIDNIWHALKVGFANEVGSIAKQLELDGQEVMQYFCQDEKLNISSYYLRPGFAYGGSCLPKDLRAMTHKASRLDVEVPIINSIANSNQRHIQRGIDLVLRQGSKKIGILGFSFKAGTDDLRESPIIELIEHLLGKGCDVRIYDKNVALSKLMGANRNFILNHIPHISGIMVESIDEVLEHADTLVIGNGAEEFRDIVSRLKPEQTLIDLVGVAKPEKASDNYEGIGW